MITNKLLNRYPAISDLTHLAKRRMPRFAWEYLDSGTGRETALARNHAAFDAIQLIPRLLNSDLRPLCSAQLFTQKFNVPFGIAPIGLSGLIWPGAEITLANTAVQAGMPYCLSTVACQSVETIAAIAGPNTWFQLYPFRDPTINEDLINRAHNSGCSVLVVTADVPVHSLRERQRRAGIAKPSFMNVKRAVEILAAPAWLRAMIKFGKPSLNVVQHYLKNSKITTITDFMTEQQVGLVSWDELTRIRALWKGPLVLKGVLNSVDAEKALDYGVEGIVVSNHGGRQLDAVAPSIACLPSIVAAINGRIPVMLDSGIRSGLDVARALALGADFVFCGRIFLHGVAACGQAGAEHVAYLLQMELENTMIQLGVRTLEELRQHTKDLSVNLC
jgi:L-lactate dehydrogenase (cytochrome)